MEFTQEQKRLSAINHQKAVEYFESIGELPVDRETWSYVLHHKDPKIKYEDPERYIKWDPKDLIVMDPAEHSRLHNTGIVRSEETKQLLSKKIKGSKRPPFTMEHRRKLSEAAKRRKPTEMTDKTKAKISKTMKGIPKSEETKKRMSDSKKGNKNVLGRHWYNNGVIGVLRAECPEGFVEGKLIKK